MSDSQKIFETTELDEWNSTMREFVSFFRDLIVILLIVLFIRMFIVTPFRINGSSMETSYHDKEYILVDKLSYLNLPVTYASVWTGESLLTRIEKSLLSHIPVHVWDPIRWDVVVITPHVDKNREYYIKRVVGLPGDTIKFENGEVFIRKSSESGSWEFIQLDEVYLSPANKGNTRLPDSIEQNIFKIPEWYYWVMWDNRNNSADSRQCFQNCYGSSEVAHFIKRKDIVWKVLLNFWYYNIFSEGWLIQDQKLTWTYPPRFLDHPRGATYPELE